MKAKKIIVILNSALIAWFLYSVSNLFNEGSLIKDRELVQFDSLLENDIRIWESRISIEHQYVAEMAPVMLGEKEQMRLDSITGVYKKVNEYFSGLSKNNVGNSYLLQTIDSLRDLVGSDHFNIEYRIRSGDSYELYKSYQLNLLDYVKSNNDIDRATTLTLIKLKLKDFELKQLLDIASWKDCSVKCGSKLRHWRI